MTAIHVDVEQGTKEWLELRKTKITATDASVILGVSPWKTKLKLYNEKLSPTEQLTPNAAMQRGIDLEPIARDLFNNMVGMQFSPKVILKDWAMASLDGISECGCNIVEIKCPGTKDHAVALSGKVPDHYYPQIQHQIYVCGVLMAYYFSFDGENGVVVGVRRDEEYIDKMVEEELKFYNCLQTKTPPEPCEQDYVERSDDLWQKCASRWKYLNESIKELEREEERVRQELILLSGQSNVRGAGISLSQVQRKGHVNYSIVPELNGIDLEKYRKETTTSWRITCQ